MGKLSADLDRTPLRTASSRSNRPGPSKLLMSAAITGLFGFATGCDDEPPAEEDDPDTRHDTGPVECEPTESGSGGKGGSGGKDGGAQEAGSGGVGGSLVDVEVEKEISTTDVQHTYAELTALCDERKGYVEILGSCSSVNSCKGFSYGDWGEESQLVEHTCSGVNGCAGLSCVIPERAGSKGDMTGEEIMKLDDKWYLERGGAYGPKACRTCHAESTHNDETGDYDYDYSKLKIPVLPGSGRNASNWTQRSAAYQERVVAFGAQHITEDGVRISSMVPYAKLFSKEEIRRVVEFMRNYDPKDVTIKELKLEPGKAKE